MDTGRVSLFGGSRSSGLVYSGGGRMVHDRRLYPGGGRPGSRASRRAVPWTRSWPPNIRSGLVTLGYQAANGWRADAAGSVFDEDRDERHAGLRSTPRRRGSVSVDVAGGVGGGLLSLRGFGGTQGYRPDILGGQRRPARRKR